MSALLIERQICPIDQLRRGFASAPRREADRDRGGLWELRAQAREERVELRFRLVEQEQSELLSGRRFVIARNGACVDRGATERSARRHNSIPATSLRPAAHVVATSLPIERTVAPAYAASVGFRFYRRRSFGRGLWLGLSKSGVSGGRRGKRLSVSAGRRGAGGSFRLMKGLS